MPKFEVFVGADAKFYFRLKAANGEIVCQSQGYFSRDNARRAIDTLTAIVCADPPVENVD